MMRRRYQRPAGQRYVDAVPAGPELAPAPELGREGPISTRLWSPIVEYPTIPKLPAFARRRRRPLIILVVLGLILGAGAGAGNFLLARYVSTHQMITSPHVAATFATGQQGHTQGFSLPDIPTAPPVPSAVLTATMPPLPDFSLPPFCNVSPTGKPGDGTLTPTAAPGCVACPYLYDHTPYTTAQVKAALEAAAAIYHLPAVLVEGEAWGESDWVKGAGLISCSYDAGVMQIKQGYMEWIDELADSNCGLSFTPYNPYTLRDNALMGAKLIAFIECYYGWRAGVGGTQAEPAPETSAWYYQQAGLSWPDTTTASGAPNPKSLCAAERQDTTLVYPADSPTLTWGQVYQAFPADTPWSCPFSAKAGDATLLQIALSVYQEGTGTMDAEGITNWHYVDRLGVLLSWVSEGKTPAP